MIITLENDFLTCEINSFGGEIMSVRDMGGIEYIWQGDPKYWEGHAPNCFPFETELKGGAYIYDGNRYEIVSHGFLRSLRMIVDSLTGESLALSASDNRYTRLQYPFHFIFKIEYRLTGRTLTVNYTVANLGSDPMYFSIAGHPGFNIPLERKASFGDYRIRFPEGMEPRRICTTEDGLLTGGSDEEFELEDGSCVNLDHDMFKAGPVLLSDTGGVLAVESEKHDRSFVVSFINMPYVCLWQRPGAPFLCIEPWTSLPPVARTEPELERLGLIYLRDGGDYTTSYSISCL